MSPIPFRLYEQTWPEGEFRQFQLGFVVDDLIDAAVRWADAFGVGPFHVNPRGEAPCTYRGTRSAVDVQTAIAQAGPAQIELIQQHCDRPSIYRDLFDRGESGFHQLCTVTRDYDGKKAHYERLGYELATEFELDVARVAYYDTAADFGFITEVVEEEPGFLARWTEVSRACAEWDGDDPIRVRTDRGYERRGEAGT